VGGKPRPTDRFSGELALPGWKLDDVDEDDGLTSLSLSNRLVGGNELRAQSLFNRPVTPVGSDSYPSEVIEKWTIQPAGWTFGSWSRCEDVTTARR
jgi:hypothetical protein